MIINQKGITLVEALVVMVLIAIILAISTPMTLRAIRRYRCEEEVRSVYSSWMDARQRAMERNIPYLIQVRTTSVFVYEDRDRDNVADNNELQPELSQPTLAFPLTGTVDGSSITAVQTAKANDRGIIEVPIEVGITNVQSPFNCIRTNVTTIGLGKYNGTNCVIQ